MTPEDELLIEQVTASHRDADPTGRLRAHPAWHDLDDAGRLAAFEATVVQRALEAGLQPEGLSTTALAVLARLAR